MTYVKVPPDPRYHEVWRPFRFWIPADKPIRDSILAQLPLIERAARQYEKKYRARWRTDTKIWVGPAPPIPEEVGPDGTFEAEVATRRETALYLNEQELVPCLVYLCFIEPVLWLETGALIEREKAFREQHQVELPEPLQRLVPEPEEVIKGERTT